MMDSNQKVEVPMERTPGFHRYWSSGKKRTLSLVIMCSSWLCIFRPNSQPLFQKNLPRDMWADRARNFTHFAGKKMKAFLIGDSATSCITFFQCFSHCCISQDTVVVWGEPDSTWLKQKGEFNGKMMGQECHIISETTGTRTQKTLGISTPA